jgi:hypothetical protein
MMISRAKKFIYIHVDRTGGTTFSRAFKKYTHFQWSHRFHLLCLRTFGEMPKLQLLAEQTALELRGKLDQNIWEENYKFAMIRNPYEWMVSNYSYIRQYEAAWHHNLVAKMTFVEFVDWRLGEAWKEIDPLGLNRGLSAWFTDENGEVIIDYVGRFEHFEQEFNLFCERIGVSSTLPHLNKSKFKSVDKYYTTSTKAQVQEKFALDFKLFGYNDLT